MYWKLYNIVRLSENKYKKCDNRFSEINTSLVSAGIASENGVSNMQRIMIHLNLSISVAPCSYSKILNTIVQTK